MKTMILALLTATSFSASGMYHDRQNMVLPLFATVMVANRVENLPPQDPKPAKKKQVHKPAQNQPKNNQKPQHPIQQPNKYTGQKRH